jgi:hypothetical protein
MSMLIVPLKGLATAAHLSHVKSRFEARLLPSSEHRPYGVMRDGERGEHELKGISEAWRLFAVLP